MATKSFIGRKEELTELNDLLSKKVSSLITIKGQHRIGKSRLIDEFAKKYKTYKFIGLPPDRNLNAQMQRDEFMHVLCDYANLPYLKVDNWSTLFSLLAREVANNRAIIVFDELSWMGSKDPTFLPKLKTAWDELFKKNPKLILILCSSASTWMEENVLSSTGFYGRISYEQTLKPLPLSDCNTLLETLGFKGSPYEKLKILSVTGAIPWYIEQIQGKYSAEENIKKLCFASNGLLVKEFDRIFKDIFSTRDIHYKSIVNALVSGATSYKSLAEKSKFKSSGRFSQYLNDLITAGFISRDYTWTLKSGALARHSQYRLCDNYARFYLKYIQPKRRLIDENQHHELSTSSLPGWSAMIGLQFENLVLNNKKYIIQSLNLKPDDILADNPYIQKSTKHQKGCQIDYLIQTKYNNLYACEIKFKNTPINTKVVNEVKEKIDRLITPKNTVILPVLVHVNGISKQVIESDYFYRVIDFSELLTIQ